MLGGFSVHGEALSGMCPDGSRSFETMGKDDSDLEFLRWSNNEVVLGCVSGSREGFGDRLEGRARMICAGDRLQRQG